MINTQTDKAIRRYALQTGYTVKHINNVPQLVDEALEHYRRAKASMSVFIEGKSRRR